MKRKSTIFLCFVFLTTVFFIPEHALAAGGNILYLNAWGGYAPDTTVTIQTTVQAIPSFVNRSNLFYTITAPDNSIVATHTTDLARIDAYQTVTDEWSSTNSGWPEGWYTVRVCWSPGGSKNCSIAGPFETTVRFVPTLGWGLSLAGAALVLYWAWRRRSIFEKVLMAEKR